jgi:hypothetical protein
LETKGKIMFLGEGKGKQNGEIKALLHHFNSSVFRHIDNQIFMKEREQDDRGVEAFSIRPPE